MLSCYVFVQIAAGLKAEMYVEIYAIAAGVEGNRGVGCIQHSLQITTETDNLVVPIAANILSVSLHFIPMEVIKVIVIGTETLQLRRSNMPLLY